MTSCFQDRLQRVTVAGNQHEAVSMFAGTQSATTPFRAAGCANVWNVEINQVVDMGPLHAKAIVQCVVDLSSYHNGRPGELVTKEYISNIIIYSRGPKK